MNPVRVLVVDDQEVFRRVMSAVVDHTEGFVLVGCAGSGEESIVTAGVLRPDSDPDGREPPRYRRDGGHPQAARGYDGCRRRACCRPTTRTTGMDRCRSAAPSPTSPSPRSDPTR